MSVEVFKNELYIGGNFDLEPFAGIAKFDGLKWDSAGNGVRGGGPPVVTSLQVYNNKLFAAGMWININNLPNPSCAAWDGEKWLNLGGLIYEGGQPAVINELKVYKNKLFVFGGFDYADTLPVHNIAIWNDTNWCGTKIEINFAPRIIENYKDHWYFMGPKEFMIYDTVNYLGKYIGNNSKLENNCYDAPIIPIPDLGVFPNPTDNYINFNLINSVGEKCNLKIVSELGQIINSFTNIDSNSKLDISSFAAGLYFFIFEGNVRITYKILKI